MFRYVYQFTYIRANYIATYMIYYDLLCGKLVMHYQESAHDYLYICLHLIGNGYELVEAVGAIVIGHFSIDGELKKEHFTSRHHNMLVVSQAYKN